MKQIDREVTKLIWYVHRCNRGCWQEIYHTPDEQSARLEAIKMGTWDFPTRVTSRMKTFIEDIEDE